MHELIDLDGWNVARARVEPGQDPVLSLICAGGRDENGAYPPESFTLVGKEGVRELHALLGRMLEAQAEHPSLPKLPQGVFGGRL